jgi:hypothetical protein
VKPTRSLQLRHTLLPIHYNREYFSVLRDYFFSSFHLNFSTEVEKTKKQNLYASL